MRKGYHGGFIELDGKIVGINLGCDATSEHEWGIQKLRDAFHVDGENMGYEYFVANPPFPELHVLNNGDEIMVIYDPIFQYLSQCTANDYKALQQDFELSIIFDDMAAAWDDESFGIAVKGKENQEKLTEALLKPYADGDLMFLVTRLFSSTPGLTIMRASVFPEEERQKLLEKHNDKIALEKASQKTGIHEILRKAKKEYIALTPRWAKDFEKAETKYPVLYWLNPMHQNVDHYGYFTVEELIAWTKDEGPIPMRK